MADTPATPTFPVTAIAEFPAPGMTIPGAFTFSPDDAAVRYLAGTPQQPAQQLYIMDITDGVVRVLVAPPGGGTQEVNLSPEEELRRQRTRTLTTGLTSYAVNDRSGRILIPLSGDIFVQDGPDAPLRCIFAHGDGAPAQDAAFDPAGSQVAFVQDGEI